jgi:hypothetical protein
MAKSPASPSLFFFLVIDRAFYRPKTCLLKRSSRLTTKIAVHKDRLFSAVWFNFEIHINRQGQNKPAYSQTTKVDCDWNPTQKKITLKR